MRCGYWCAGTGTAKPEKCAAADAAAVRPAVRSAAAREAMKMGQGNNCESCAYYLYDEDYECYVCDMDLDEDEMAHFMMGNFSHCPYFQLYDEYKIVRKQM